MNDLRRIAVMAMFLVQVGWSQIEKRTAIDWAQKVLHEIRTQQVSIPKCKAKDDVFFSQFQIYWDSKTWKSAEDQRAESEILSTTQTKEFLECRSKHSREISIWLSLPELMLMFAKESASQKFIVSEEGTSHIKQNILNWFELEPSTPIKFKNSLNGNRNVFLGAIHIKQDEFTRKNKVDLTLEIQINNSDYHGQSCVQSANVYIDLIQTDESTLDGFLLGPKSWKKTYNLAKMDRYEACAKNVRKKEIVEHLNIHPLVRIKINTVSDEENKVSGDAYLTRFTGAEFEYKSDELQTKQEVVMTIPMLNHLAESISNVVPAKEVLAIVTEEKNKKHLYVLVENTSGDQIILEGEIDSLNVVSVQKTRMEFRNSMKVFQLEKEELSYDLFERTFESNKRTLKALE